MQQIELLYRPGKSHNDKRQSIRIQAKEWTITKLMRKGTGHRQPSVPKPGFVGDERPISTEKKGTGFAKRIANFSGLNYNLQTLNNESKRDTYIRSWKEACPSFATYLICCFDRACVKLRISFNQRDETLESIIWHEFSSESTRAMSQTHSNYAILQNYKNNKQYRVIITSKWLT